MVPVSAQDNKQLALRLISHLRSGIKNTHGQVDWTTQNLNLLRAFANEVGSTGYPSGKETPKDKRLAEFLWDFIAYTKGKGILIAAESEHGTDLNGIKHDFEKLFYVRSPVKLMLIRIRKPEEATVFKDELHSYMTECCSEFSSAEVFVLYCVWWSQKEKNRDIAYLLQIDGVPQHRPLGLIQFEPVPD